MYSCHLTGGFLLGKIFSRMAPFDDLDKCWIFETLHIAGFRALHRPVWHQACRRSHSSPQSRMARQLLWVAVSRGLARVPQGDAPVEHSPEPPGLHPDRDQVSRTADNRVAYWALRVFQEFWRFLNHYFPTRYGATVEVSLSGSLLCICYCFFLGVLSDRYNNRNKCVL